MKVKKILVSQPQPAELQKSPYTKIAAKYGVDVVFRPFVKVVSVSTREFRDQKINLAEYGVILFTARTAIDHFFSMCKEIRYEVPETQKYLCTTEQIALYLQKYIQYRKRKINFTNTGKIEDLKEFFTKYQREKFLLPVSDVHKDNEQVLDKMKLNYRKAVMFRTVSNDFEPDEAFDYDMLLFFSPSGVKSLMKNFPDFKQGDIAIGGLGAATAQEITAQGLHLDISAPSAECRSMDAAVDKYLREHNG